MDPRDPTMLGGELLRWLELHRERRNDPAIKPSTILDEGTIVVPGFDEAQAMRERQAAHSNGHAPQKPEPTHGLSAPPDLTEADVPLETSFDRTVAQLFVGAAPVFPTKCGSCDAPHAYTPRGRPVCLNETCDRYEVIL